MEDCPWRVVRTLRYECREECSGCNPGRVIQPQNAARNQNNSRIWPDWNFAAGCLETRFDTPERANEEFFEFLFRAQ